MILAALITTGISPVQSMNNDRTNGDISKCELNIKIMENLDNIYDDVLNLNDFLKNSDENLIHKHKRTESFEEDKRTESFEEDKKCNFEMESEIPKNIIIKNDYIFDATKTIEWKKWYNKNDELFYYPDIDAQFKIWNNFYKQFNKHCDKNIITNEEAYYNVKFEELGDLFKLAYDYISKNKQSGLKLIQPKNSMTLQNYRIGMLRMVHQISRKPPLANTRIGLLPGNIEQLTMENSKFENDSNTYMQQGVDRAPSAFLLLPWGVYSSREGLDAIFSNKFFPSSVCLNGAVSYLAHGGGVSNPLRFLVHDELHNQLTYFFIGIMGNDYFLFLKKIFELHKGKNKSDQFIQEILLYFFNHIPEKYAKSIDRKELLTIGESIHNNIINKNKRKALVDLKSIYSIANKKLTKMDLNPLDNKMDNYAGDTDKEDDEDIIKIYEDSYKDRLIKYFEKIGIELINIQLIYKHKDVISNFDRKIVKIAYLNKKNNTEGTKAIKLDVFRNTLTKHKFGLIDLGKIIQEFDVNFFEKNKSISPEDLKMPLSIFEAENRDIVNFCRVAWGYAFDTAEDAFDNEEYPVQEKILGVLEKLYDEFMRIVCNEEV